jgi:transcriptional regulator with XRE-family HTH domain
MAESFGKRLRRYRRNHPDKLSIREVARRASIDVSYLSRMEKDEVPPPRTEVILRLAGTLGVLDSDELLLLANKIPPDIEDIIRDHSEEVPSFLRTAKGLSQEEWNRVTNYVRRNLLSKKDRNV